MLEGFATATRPLWMDTAVIKKYPRQTGPVSVDVCIIGGGITGLTTADLLKRAGRTVAIVEMGRIGHGETGHSTAHVTEVFDMGYKELIANFGLEGAQLASQSMRRAIDRIHENIALYDIHCSFRRVPGYRFTENRDQVEAIEEDAAAALRLGVPNELLYEAPLPFRIARAVRFDFQAQFNPLAYLAGLAERIPGDGSFIFEDTRMVEVEEGEPCRVVTDHGTITADEVVVAANVPSLNRFFVHTKIAPYRTYAVALEARDDFDATALYWDLEDPYHYIRSYMMNDRRYLIIGGEDHKTGQEDHTGAALKRLESWARQRFSVDSIGYRWSGQIIEPVDGLPYIGRNPLSDHVFIATGYSGNGITFGTIAGMLISDQITGQLNPWEDLYDAKRIKPWAGVKAFLAENIDYPSHLIGDRITPAQESDPAHLRENEGAIVRMGGKKVAVFRDPQGELHYLSPVCPHLGCYVNWNEAEKSWDCPCHGSRFSPEGKLLNGPAVADLASESFEENAPMIPERYDMPPNQEVTPPVLT